MKQEPGNDGLPSSSPGFPQKPPLEHLLRRFNEGVPNNSCFLSVSCDVVFTDIRYMCHELAVCPQRPEEGRVRSPLAEVRYT